MRYQLLKPDEPIDPRNQIYDSVATLHAAMPPVLPNGFDLESDAADELHELYPNGLAMPVPLKVGSGTVWMLGVIEDVSAPINPDATIPFVMFVQAIAERDRERARISTHMHWNKKLWRTPVAKPDRDHAVVDVELRATDLDNPAIVEATFGKAPDGRTIIYLEHNGVEMSLAFKE